MIKLHLLPALFFDKILLERPRLIIVCLLTAVVCLSYQARNFRLDASAETLVLEHDEDLRYSRVIDSRYGIEDFLLFFTQCMPVGTVFRGYDLH